MQCALLLGGTSCIWPPRGAVEVLPPVISPVSTLDQVVGEINANTARVTSIQVPQGTLSMSGAPSLTMNMALQQPLNLRIRAGTVLTGPELDLGSNPELFWLWVRRMQPPATYFCRQDQFAASAARQLMPVEPEWLFEAMGLVRFSPADQPRGPFPVGKGRLQIQSVHHSAAGDLRKVTVVDDTRGVVLEQHLYDTRNARIASAFTSNFHRDPVTGAILPRDIQIQYPSTQFDLKIHLDDLQVNTLGPPNAQLWVKPGISGLSEREFGRSESANSQVLARPSPLWTRGNGFSAVASAPQGAAPPNAQLMNPTTPPGYNPAPGGGYPGGPAASIASLPQRPAAGSVPVYSPPGYTQPSYAQPPGSSIER